MEEKTDTKVRYDERKKELTQEIVATKDIEMDKEIVGQTSMERKAVLNESGIRKVLKDLSGQQSKIEQEIKQVKNALKDAPELTDAQKKLEEDIKAINDFNKNTKLKSQLEVHSKDLKAIRKDIKEIKDAVGTRLKL